MEQGSWVEYHPLTTVTEGSPIKFDISGTGEDYIDFANKAKLTANDGANLVADAAVGPVNLFLHSLFSQVDVSLNSTLITASTNTYPYRAMLETLLTYGEEVPAYMYLIVSVDCIGFDHTLFIIMRPSSLGGGRILRRTLSVRLSVCLSVCPSVPCVPFWSVTWRHLANYNDTLRAA